MENCSNQERAVFDPPKLEESVLFAVNYGHSLPLSKESVRFSITVCALVDPDCCLVFDSKP